MAKGQTQSMDDRVASLIREAAGKIAGGKNVPVGDGGNSSSTRGVDPGAPVREDGPFRKRPGFGLDNHDDAGDHAGIDIYGAHPKDD